MSTVALEEHGQVLLITLDRPEVLNAVDGAMTRELSAAIDLLERMPHLRVAIITGAGRAFSSGLDMRAVAAGASIEATRHETGGFAGLTARRVTKPLIAAVNGVAVGGGLEIALACDLIVAAENARLGLPEVRHGLFAAGGGVLRLAQQLPERVARELVLTGRLFTSTEALAWGLVNRVVSVDDTVAEALRLATEIAQAAPLAVRATRNLLQEVGRIEATDAHSIAVADAEAALVFASADAVEGLAAFAAKRPPVFTGR